MESKEYTTIDRSKWKQPFGEWDGEPDKAQWPDPVTGLPCLAVRHSTSGHWCGYVGVSEGHPYFGRPYDEALVECIELTFADKCHPNATEDHGICHIAGEGEPDHVWWFGFDFAHAGDTCPGYMNAYEFLDSSYKTLAVVKRECADLAAQLIKWS